MISKTLAFTYTLTLTAENELALAEDTVAAFAHAADAETAFAGIGDVALTHGSPEPKQRKPRGPNTRTLARLEAEAAHHEHLAAAD